VHRIIEWPEVGQDLLAEVSREEAELFTRLDGGARQDDPLYVVLEQGGDRRRNREVVLPVPAGPMPNTTGLFWIDLR